VTVDVRRPVRLRTSKYCPICPPKAGQETPGNANARHSGPHAKARAELTGAAGNHTSSTRRVRRCRLADIDLPPAFVRRNHAVSWTARDDTRRLHGLILVVMAVQLIVGRAEPVFPHFIMRRRLPTKQLLWLGDRAIHILKYLEKAVHPRWPTTFEVAKRAVGIMVLLLAVVLLLMPVPLSNVAPAMVISLISLAYVEEDGLLLSAAFLAAIILIGIGSAAVWGAIVGAALISS
jgi:hypothetical protein